jgi:hypothetical protein
LPTREGSSIGVLPTHLGAELTKQFKAECRIPSEPHEQLTLSYDEKSDLTDGTHTGGSWQRFEQRHLTEELAPPPLTQVNLFAILVTCHTHATSRDDVHVGAEITLAEHILAIGNNHLRLATSGQLPSAHHHPPPIAATISIASQWLCVRFDIPQSETLDTSLESGTR